MLIVGTGIFAYYISRIGEILKAMSEKTSLY